ncbi:MAG: hypothetical protein JRN15_22525 [Nitrososphaerota archaeon]|nr:hypothetical protein [Nitrososphaerota archaeon]
MESKEIAIVGIAVLIIAGVVVALGTIPSSAFGGQSVTVCNVNIDVEGTYNDVGLGHWTTGFSLSSGTAGCHQKTLLDLIPSSSSAPLENIFPTTISMNLVLVSQVDGSTHGPYSIKVNIPALETQYNFQQEISVANVPVGSYSAQITSSVPFGSPSGQLSYSTSITVSG